MFCSVYRLRIRIDEEGVGTALVNRKQVNDTKHDERSRQQITSAIFVGILAKMVDSITMTQS